ncbi:hypothetical protein BDV24DRAFT_143959 [Aspergillus arachidicola]|uniref:Uncharacterized protein n=1 Tax=Aspergillus arachidicola TaxID=656916 RepID=A0A5N6XRR6_9EURO|nr:hypothetical protein BDV24DRAFT_143959 [Aspergillus arachidicola]
MYLFPDSRYVHINSHNSEHKYIPPPRIHHTKRSTIKTNKDPNNPLLNLQIQPKTHNQLPNPFGNQSPSHTPLIPLLSISPSHIVSNIHPPVRF